MTDVRVSVAMGGSAGGGVVIRYRSHPQVAECFRDGMQRHFPDLPVTIDAGEVAGLREIPCARLYFLEAGLDYVQQ